MKILIILLALLPLDSLAEITHANCSPYFETYEKKYDLPKNLLSSVSITETGRWDKSRKTLYSWPWSVNHSGKAFYFDNKNEAVEFVSKLIIKGYKNIDVGCMQVNLKHHPFAFENLHQAFEPKHNIAYAAELIKKNYLNTASWVSAIAQYHSGEKERGIRYATKVLKLWKEHVSNHKTEKQELKKRDPSQKIFRTPGRNPLRLKNENMLYLNKKNNNI